MIRKSEGWMYIKKTITEGKGVFRCIKIFYYAGKRNQQRSNQVPKYHGWGEIELPFVIRSASPTLYWFPPCRAEHNWLQYSSVNNNLVSARAVSVSRIFNAANNICPCATHLFESLFFVGYTPLFDKFQCQRQNKIFLSYCFSYSHKLVPVVWLLVANSDV